MMKIEELEKGPFPDYVLAADAEAAIAAAFQSGMEQMIGGIEQVSYDRGQSDMLAKCIEAIQVEFAKSREPADVHDAIDALRALEGDQP